MAKSSQSARKKRSAKSQLTFNNKPASKLVYLLSDDEALAADIITKLEHFNYYANYFIDFSAFEAACEKEMPAVIIVDMVFNESNSEDIITRLKAKEKLCPPLIIVSEHDDIESRFAAVRAGASRYFHKPLNIKKLSQTIKGLTAQSITSSCRVLIIDDDEALLKYHSLVLRNADMEVETLSDPLKSLEVIAEFKPDLIVVDVYMPACSGLELAKVIRQDDDFAIMPIVFLSGESNPELQMEAMSLGGNDFLVKPIAVDHLISAVKTRAKRARWINRINLDLSDALRESEYLTSTIDQHDIISIADVTGRITSVNDKFCEISGYSHEELIGQNHRILKSNRHPDSFYVDMWKTISKGHVWQGIICNHKKNGEEYWVDSTIVPFLDAKGKPDRYVSARTDITLVLQSEERLERSQEFANIGTWDWNIKTGALFWSDRIWPLFGYDKEVTETTYDNFMAAIHPDDRNMISDAVTSCVEKGIPYNIEHRVIWPDGSIHWLNESGDVVRDKNNTPLHMLGVVQDITERVEAETRVKKYNEILELIAKGGTLNIVLESVIKHAEEILNKAICSILLLDESGRYLKDGIAPGLPDYYNDAINGLEIGMGAGSCGEAAHTGKHFIASDISVNPNWHAYRDVAKKAGLKACWSEPIFSSSGTVLGTFAIYYPMIKEPVDSELKLLGQLAQFVAIVVERSLAQQTLVKAKEDAENANRAKSQFLSSMSHELRTPMNAIMGFSQLLNLEIEQPLNESQKENVSEILKASDHLLELINEVLDLAKIEAGRIELSIEDVFFGDVIVESLQLIMPLAEKRGITIELFHEGTETSLIDLVKDQNIVRADHTRLKQVIINLLSNAVKYNSENGKITIKCKKSGNNIRVSITDEGGGLNQDQLDQLFTAFNRLGAENTDIEGTGIGLVITQNIVELMGGKIGVKSEVGTGSTFWFELPSGSVGSDDEEQAADVSKIKIDLEESRTVLYIEDNPANLRLVTQLLGKLPNLHMWSAHEPMLGLELATENIPDLILLDINLPGTDGYEVLKLLRQRDRTRDIPVIAISANAMPKDIEKGFAAGFADYITKPIDIHALLAAVDDKLKK